MPTSLYLTTGAQVRKDELIKKLSLADDNEKIGALTQIVAQMSQGEDFSSLAHKITRQTMVSKNNELKRLFYYYLELIPKERESDSYGEILLLSNQIRKDLEHPNEYVRGFTMKFVSTLGEEELVSNFYKLVKANLNHPNSYVRRNAYYCLGSIYCKLDGYKEVPELLYSALFRDLDANCLRQAFVSLHMTSPELALRYAGEASITAPMELLTAIIEALPSEALVMRFLNCEETRTALESALALHRCTSNEALLRKSTDVVLKALSEQPEEKEHAIDELSRSSFSFSGYALDFLNLMDSYDLSLCGKCLSFVFKISETHEYLEIFDFLSRKFSETASLSVHKQSFRILLLEKMAFFASIYSTFSQEMVDAALQNITSESPALGYASLKFISACLKIMAVKPDGEQASEDYVGSIDLLLKKIGEIKFGKILRYALEILQRHGDREVFKKLVELLDSSFESQDKPLYLRHTQTFLGAFICMVLSKMCEGMEDKELKGRVIAIMLKFISHGKRNEIIDLSSYSTIISSIRALVHPSISRAVESRDRERYSIDVLHPLESDEIGPEGDVSWEVVSELLSNGDETVDIGNVVQLTGLSDPIYVEATVRYTRFEIVLDMLFINQTESYLQNVLLDFVTSQNIAPASINTPFSLSGRSVITKALSFKVAESTNGFISGSITFKYPGESGEYANTVYSLNLSEIGISVSDFLEARKMSPEEFRELWRTLEWENTYTLRLSTSWSLGDIFSGVARALKAETLSKECDKSYGVGNMVCSTFQGTSILVNVCMQKSDLVYFECRTRSKSESIVKSISMVVAEALKLFRNK
jgi:coatomer subunit beta